MSCATARTITLAGLLGHLVDVEVDVSQGLVGTNLVGRPDAAINEARERCRTAIKNAGLTWPATRRVTILLSPADLPKRGSQVDLAIAVGVLAATGQVPPALLDGTVFLGEVGLTGQLRPLPAALPLVMSAARSGVRRVVVPQSQAAEASLVPGIEVFGLRSLQQVVAWLQGTEVPDAAPVAPQAGARLLQWRGDDRLAHLDLADLDGMLEERLALEVAAAGGHHLLLTGPKGAGKTSLAERLPGLLPDLTVDESLEVTAIRSLDRTLGPDGGLVTRPPYAAPHHRSSLVSVIGGGSGIARPGEISKAHCGVVMLDEFPLFARDVLDALRQPLESGEVTIARGEEVATFPAQALFVLACNPCACGNYAASVALDQCICSEQTRREYRRRLTGPAIDRIDITREVLPVASLSSGPLDPVPEDSATVRARVTEARGRQAARYADLPWRLNAQVPAARLRDTWPLPEVGQVVVDSAVRSGALTRRGTVRVHRLAWTLADLAGRAVPIRADVEVALRLRTGARLDSWMVGRAS
ncbi:YifB family Mg chelatase-like AAA ATPase [Nocardioides jiangxiensis]|uniref:YifB family Mg chelatase-like AAA ATPase n=1 Tax=Nocardioides jiangxiensis TaxID=3064524 RepID=A0ABT9B2X1_9ACTN|nr:YifB family Mg chelatase-like AAA ATPase [Nocardioides sp. WY-20]MDO7869201.1 YifB family Mg chelatase-like AAA ATPase [Nocardioides sp. WY-20]